MGSYLQQFKNATDQLAASHSPVSDLLVCILNGLSTEYRPLASSIRARSSCITIEELHSLLIAEELCLLDESSYENMIALAAQHQQSSTRRQFKQNKGSFQNFNGPSNKGGQAKFLDSSFQITLLLPMPATTKASSSFSNRIECQIC